MEYSPEESFYRFLRSGVHFCLSFAPYFPVILIVASLLWYVPTTYTYVMPAAFVLVVFPLLDMMIWCLRYRSKKPHWKKRPLTMQVIYASRRIDLADHNPLKWCHALIRKKRASLFDTYLTWGALPLIITITTLEQLLRLLICGHANSDNTAWTLIEHMLDRREKIVNQQRS